MGFQEKEKDLLLIEIKLIVKNMVKKNKINNEIYNMD